MMRYVYFVAPTLALLPVLPTLVMNSGHAFANAPPFIPVQGFLTDAAGDPVDGSLEITFAIYETETGDNPAFEERQVVTVEDGAFAVELGQVTSVDLGLYANRTDLWLGIKVGSDDEMTPRLPLGTVPFAAFAERAGDAARFGARPPSDYRLAADDRDALGGLSCPDGQVAKRVSGSWSCADDRTLGESEVDAYVSDNGYALASSLASVATSGDYSDLSNRPATLGGLSCAPGEVAAWSGSSWGCAARVSGGGVGGRIALFSTNDALTSSVIHQAGARIGIGIASPSSALEVAGRIRETCTEGDAQARWTAGNGHCYFRLDETSLGVSLTFAAAHAACLARGAYVATLTTAGEQAFVAARLNANQPWIGLSDVRQEGAFEWITGEIAPVSNDAVYTNWVPGQPDNVGNEDCAEMTANGTWNDVSCVSTGPASVICEREL